ncbi:type II secretion system protein [Phragmitibacter flavus]|uniref:Type II secretion system protein n=1 Tax=Phragmitibacter flavus TaxID=2576071 RepID=A0A5R8KIP3_9BACT|nr:type II secretion system protein [Phragmitibacter flavus]TLD72188.1 type II secretion system protein [Phragmitibacter flavus]
MKLQPHVPHRCRKRAFTLLEMVMVMFVLTLLLGSIFAIVRGTVQLTDELAVVQTRESRMHGLSRLCERMFRHLPAQAMVRLRNKQIGSRYLYQLALVNVPSPMSASGEGAEVSVLETDEAPDGYLRLFLRSLNTEHAMAWERGEGEAGTRLLLLDQVAMLEWRFFNPRSGEWEPLWNEAMALPLEERRVTNAREAVMTPEDSAVMAGQTATSAMGAMERGQRPQLIELRVAVGAEEPQRMLFWAPNLKAQ